MKYLVVEYEDIQLPSIGTNNFKPAVMSFSHLERCEGENGDVRIVNLCDCAASFRAVYHDVLGAWVVETQVVPEAFKDTTPTSRRFIIGDLPKAMEYLNA